MKRNIVTNFLIQQDAIGIQVYEKLPTATVELFNVQSPWTDYHLFIKETLRAVEKVVGGKISRVSVILDPFEEVKQQINLVSQSIKIPNGLVQRQDIDNLLALVRENNATNQRALILIQPLRFQVHDVVVKNYSSAPLNKRGQKLTALLAVTTISRQIESFINKLVQVHELKINQIVLTPQARALASASDGAQSQGVASLDLSGQHAYLTLIKNHAVVLMLQLAQSGYRSWLKTLTQKFAFESEKIERLLLVHADLAPGEPLQVSPLSVDQPNLTSGWLTQFCQVRLARILLVVRGYLEKKLGSRYLDLPFVIVGGLTSLEGLEEFARHKLGQQNVSVYAPMTFVEQSSHNLPSLGLIKLMEKSDQISGVHYDTIVETNPDLLSDFKLVGQKSKGFWNRIYQWIGGRNGWN